MATIINASTTAGLIQTADTSGILNLQSNGTTKVAVSSSGVDLTGLSKSSLPTGSVLQVIQGTYSTAGSVIGTTAVASGLTATITPNFATSKILVLVNQQGIYGTGVVSSFAGQVLFRGATQIQTFDYITGYVSGGNGGGSCSTTYLDSPATTLSTTYSTKIANNTTGTTNWNNAGNTTSTITLMEIAG